MEYFGIFLILVAAGLRLVGPHLSGAKRQLRRTDTFRGVHAVPPGAAAILLAFAGVFIFVVGISSR